MIRILVRQLWVTAFLTALISPAVSAAPERELGAPRFDTEAETTHRRVRWEDFKGGGTSPSFHNRWSRGGFAHISSGLKPGAFEVETRREGEDWVAVPVGLRPYAVMDKYHSAVRPGARKAEVLAHEQLHFDITETLARRLAVELAGFEGRGPTAADARGDLDRRLRERFEKAFVELRELQGQYDGETAHSVKRKQQKQWAAKIEMMFREATEALVELLETRGE